jgi:NAD(P)-dependent dehydrogenase (short-subunit alcohol dehydrogenase family)
MKVAVVTGGNRGIGQAIATALQNSGFTVVSASRSEGFKCDISKTEDRAALLNYVINKHGRVDILVNNAGVAPDVRSDILQASEQSFDKLIDINTKGTFFMCQLFANQMVKLMGKIENYNPKIINISSVSAYTSSTSRGEYCISKAGLSMVTKLFADRLAGEGIAVFEVRPGIILTDMTAPVRDKYQKLIDEGLTPIKRFGEPQDVANAVLALSSGLLDFGTGTIINADGGFHIRRL